MKGTLLLIFFNCLISLAFAQTESFENRKSVRDFHTRISFSKNYESIESSVAEYFQKNTPELSAGSSLKLKHRVNSPNGYHLYYEQCINNIPIAGSSLKVNLNKDYVTTSVAKCLMDPRKISSEAVETEKIKAAVTKLFPAYTILNSHPVYFPLEGALAAAGSFEIQASKTDHYIVFVSSSGALLHKQYLNFSKSSNDDTLVTAKVFLPDPITTASTTYAGNYKDFADSDNSELNNERKSVTMRVDFENDSFVLRSAYIIIKDIGNQADVPVKSATPNFDFTRSQSGFEDVNVFYHIQVYKNYINQLGYNDLANFQLPVDPHYEDVENSNYLTGSKELVFGTGGVDDAEDADVIIHEYNHAITTSASPNINFTNERRALEEGNCDYFTASYSKSITDYRWRDIYTWDGHNEFWDGRTTNSTRKYSGMTNDVYVNSEIWSSAMSDILVSLGRDKTDKLMLNALYELDENTTMPEAAQIIMQMDSIHNGFANKFAIAWAFIYRELMPQGPNSISELEEKGIEVINSIAFANGESSLQIKNASDVKSVEIINVQGQILNTYQKNSNGDFVISPDGIPAGFYVVRFDNGSFPGLKLIRY